MTALNHEQDAPVVTKFLWRKREQVWAHLTKKVAVLPQEEHLSRQDLDLTVKESRETEDPPVMPMAQVLHLKMQISAQTMHFESKPPTVKAQTVQTKNRHLKQIQTLTLLKCSRGDLTVMASLVLALKCQLVVHCTTCPASARTTFQSFKLAAVRSMPPSSRVS